jgi:hypothetical protein
MSVALFSNTIKVGPKNIEVTPTPLTAPASSWDLTKVAEIKITEIGLYWFRFNILLVMEETLSQKQIDTLPQEYQQYLMSCFIISPSGIMYPLKSCPPCYFQPDASTVYAKNSVAKPLSIRTLNITNDMLPCNEVGTWTVKVVANCGYSASDASIGYNVSESTYQCTKISNYQF